MRGLPVSLSTPGTLTLSDRCKLEVGQVSSQLGVGCRLLKLSIRLGRVEFHLPCEVHRLHHELGCFLNTHFLLFADCVGKG